MRIRLLGTVLLIAAVLAILLANEAHAARSWTGGCTVAVDITPTAQDLYGREIANALATVTLVTGLAFEPATDHADLTYQIGDTSWLGPDVLGYFDYDANAITLLPVVPAQYQGQKPAMRANVRARLVLHETLHWLGLDHDESWQSIMQPIITEAPAVMDSADFSRVRAAGLANGCKA